MSSPGGTFKNISWLLLRFAAEIEVKEGKFSSAEFLIHKKSKTFFVNWFLSFSSEVRKKPSHCFPIKIFCWTVVVFVRENKILNLLWLYLWDILVPENDFLEKAVGDPKMSHHPSLPGAIIFLSDFSSCVSMCLMSSNHVRTPSNKLSWWSDGVGTKSPWPTLARSVSLLATEIRLHADPSDGPSSKSFARLSLVF